ncbi:MAG: NCS2 family permease [Planctomycetes bacterium]|nr:NCS2 family permease [Planctomycetota bacterium]
MMMMMMTTASRTGSTGLAGSRLPVPGGIGGGDIDGLFGLLVDNLIQLLVILALLKTLVHMPGDQVLHHVIPAVGVSVIFGNLFYAVQAWWGARREGVHKTALPYGINTPSVFAYILFIMLPVYYLKFDGSNTDEAWQAAYAAGMIACIGSGLIEFFGSFVAQWIRASTPRAALLAALAGIALTFISMDFVVRLFADPLIGLVPLVILLAGYFGRARMPFGLPAGLVAVIVGAALAWALTALRHVTGVTWLVNDAANLREVAAVTESVGKGGWFLPDPRYVWPMIVDAFVSREWLTYLGVIIPMGLFNLVGSLQNLESAEAAGDKYATAPSLMVNGIGSILGGFLGSCFPTTIYIGHPGWKGMGAGWAYSLMNALAIGLLCLTGLTAAVEAVIPITAGAAILLWIGVIITAQSFTASPKPHAGAVAVGLFPALAALMVMVGQAPYGPGSGAIEMAPTTPITEVAQQGLEVDIEPDIETPAAGQAAPAEPTHRISTIQEQLKRPDVPDRNTRTWLGFSIHGLFRLERGMLLLSMIWAAMTAFLVDRRWVAAGAWSLVACALSLLGVIHGYAIEGNALHYLIPGLDVPAGADRYPAWDFAIAYFIIGLILILPTMLKGDGSGMPLLPPQIPPKGSGTKGLRWSGESPPPKSVMDDDASTSVSPLHSEDQAARLRKQALDGEDLEDEGEQEDRVRLDD